MSKSKFELPAERLATTDEKGSRVFLYPADVRGFFQKRRKYVHFVLMLFFLILPWIKIAGHQSVLLDIPQRRFAFFGITFWAHDAPMLILVFLSIFFAIAFITVVWGRLWCGWACPETVFIESVYRKIERLIEGDALQRKQLDQLAWNTRKIFKKSLKWTLFLLVTLIISHSFLAYFVGTEELLKMISHDPREHPTPFLVMASITGTLLFAFGWFREQFCTIMCPYGRLQSVLMDKNSLAVVYDEKRGEPRRGIVPDKAQEGDCVNCYRCVQVCPTGVDIRRGVQLECIACTACIDACDEVMLKVKKPEGLIRYDTESNLEGVKGKTFSARMIIYGLVSFFALIFLFILILNRKPVDITILKARELPYQKLSNEMISNHFKLVLSNKSFEVQSLKISLSEDHSQRGAHIVMARPEIIIQPGEDFRGDFFIEFPKQEFLHLGQGVLPLKVTGKGQELNDEWAESIEVKILGPF